MPQLNVLPVNVSQNIELKDESASFNSAGSKDDFSQYIDLHLIKNKEADSSSKVDSGKSPANTAKSIASSTVTELATKKSENVVESSDTNDETDSETVVQKVAASGNEGQIKSTEIDQKGLLESEQLMSFLTKADNTLINQSVETSSSTTSPVQLPEEQKSVEQKAHYEAQLLLNTSHSAADLSTVVKALGNDQTAVALSPTLTEQGIFEEELLLSNAAKATGNKSTIVKLPIESIEGKNKGNTQAEVSAAIVKSAENKTLLSEQNIESMTEVKLTNIGTDKPNTAEQRIAKQLKVDHAQVSNDKISQEALQKEANKSAKIEGLNDVQTSEIEDINTNTATQVNNKNQVQADSVKSLKKTVNAIENQVNLSKESQHEKISSLPDPQLIKSELTQNRETTKTNEVADIKKTVTSANPLASNHDDANKMQAKQDDKSQLSASFAEQKPVVQKDDDEVLVEDKVITNTKREPSANGHFIDVSGKVTQIPQHTIEQQSAEMLNASVATEVTQSQKTNTQLHQETISLFRKDFTEAVKDKVMLMISQKLQQFDITLDPPELGNMQVRVNLQGEQAVVNFLVQSQQTKDALEQNMHKLRELLAELGVDVGDANVEQQSQQSANEENSTAKHNSQMEGKLDNMAEVNDVVAHTLSAKMIDSSTTRVDYYA
ncbi:flagellar hook-length control protein FliK [Candidatus Colwellia aromaticivorans]|uniref:flagellar hook-length control protein FliK n=1 Tax=Candidatus Colwellia aromaticivorans TaxID=2267621 RepID=UPI001443CB0A|nr:flagellar hook-length control protein FliK [Candidatus Colwellia aromaticivorans]